MGYTTDFLGEFELDKQLDPIVGNLINGLANTRRVKRDITKLANMLNLSRQEADLRYGIEGEYYYNKNDFQNCGQTFDESIIDFNQPPETQPGLWCQWVYSEENNVIEWNGGEKFYNYVEWIKYIIERILKPNGYILNGTVKWSGDESFDRGEIQIKDNKIKILEE